MIPLKTTPTSTPASGAMLWEDLDHVISGLPRIERNQALSYIHIVRENFAFLNGSYKMHLQRSDCHPIPQHKNSSLL